MNWSLFRREPVLTGAVAQAVVIVASTLGLSLSPEQAAALMTIGSLVIGWIARMHVSPTAPNA